MLDKIWNDKFWRNNFLVLSKVLLNTGLYIDLTNIQCHDILVVLDKDAERTHSEGIPNSVCKVKYVH